MKGNIIQLLVHPSGIHEFWVNNIVDGIMHESSRRNMEIKFLNMRQLSHKAPGAQSNVLLIGYTISWMTDAITALRENGYEPLVISSAQLPMIFRALSAATFDLEEAVTTVMKHLISTGCKRVAFLGCNPDSAADEVKRKVFLSTAFDFGIEAKLEDIYPSFAALGECIEIFIKNFDNYDAAICSNDTVAIRLIQRLKKDNYKVPGDLYVTGMGNSKIGQRQKPSLTTVEFDYYELGRQAVRLYAFHKDSAPTLRVNISLHCRFLIRESTANYSKIANVGITGAADHKEVLYYSDPEVSKIIRVEDFLQHCDELDINILSGLIENETCEHMSERLSLSESAIKYRLKKMLIWSDTDSKSRLVKFVEEVLPRRENSN